ncbi:TPA: pentapeptide repeat-containing protein [Campylobacter jejuni]|nr:pentapeptide repeat-containing protein [Campylobacter jejuni]
MEELTKEQRQIIEEEIKKEIKKADTFLKPESINKKIIQDIIGNIKGNFKYPKNLEEILLSIPQKVYVSLGKEEIKQILKLDFCCFVDNVFYIDFAPKIEPYKHNQNKTAIEEQRIIQCSYDDLLYLFKTYPLIFNHCIFDYKIDKKTPIEQIKKLSFLNCNFKKEIYLHFQECLDIFQMDNCVFEDRVTIKGKFNDNVYFNNSIFKNYANFHTCEFEKTASFYGVRFEKTPNFSQAIFKGNLNAVNTNLNFTFDDLQERIKQEYKDFNKTKEEKPLDKIANDFRDSFRIFKNALIKDNNALDASNFHKYELYCKEIELKESWNKLKKVDIDEDIDQNNKNYSKLMDFLLLGFYRKLCDHHTDLLKVFNNFVLLIALYVSYSIVILHINDKEIINDTKTYLSDIFNYNNIFWYVLGILLFICVCSIYFCKNKERTHMINEKVKVKKIKWSKIIIKEIYNLLFILIVCYIGVSTFGMVGDFLAKFSDLKIFKDVAYISFVCLSFVELFLFFINSRVLRYIFLCYSYFISAFVLFLNPKEFYFIYNIFKENNENLMIINSLNVVYFVLIILVLFSLQKTARKNSIVPS